MSAIIRYDEDSGRSSCSGTSGGLSPVNDGIKHGTRRHLSKTQEASTNTDLKVSTRPRSCVINSPDDRDPFPSCRLSRNRKVANIFHLLDTPRMGGLSNAHSTLDIISSTQIEQPKLGSNAISLAAIHKNDFNEGNKLGMNFRRGNPVQRAASRLYKAETIFKGRECCVGPEFIVRASQPLKKIDLSISSNSDKRVVTVVLLNGQRIEVTCNPNIVTAGQLFESVVNREKYDHKFMLGIAALVGGDFIFLPDEYKIKKIASEDWCKTLKSKKNVLDVTITVFLRIKFFLPTNISKNIQDGEWRHRVYLQLRRATVEGQLTSTIQNLILLSGYALHIEFGEFSYREHGTADYFLLEHYLPETVITNDMADIKLRMKKAHESRHGMDRTKAILNYITLAQTFRDYGAHFYSAVWATRDGFCRDVWLSIGPRGITIYSRNNFVTEEIGNTNNNRIVLQSLPWHHIHTFYYNKKSLYVLPNSNSGLSKIGVKYKLKMADFKSYFAFWLASLHHRLYLKLYAKENFISYLTDELSCTVNTSPVTSDCSNYQDSYNLAVRNPVKGRRPVRRRFKVDVFGDKKFQNKENKKPDTEELLKKILSVQQIEDSPNGEVNAGNSSNDGLSSSESCSLPRRHGVKMGTRVFHGMKSALNNKCPRSSVYRYSDQSPKYDGDLATTQSDSDDLSSEKKPQFNINSMKLLPERHYSQDLCHTATAYVLESPKVCNDAFNLITTSNDSFLNASLFEKLDNMGCVQAERVFVTAILERNETNALGLQVAEGSDGNVYIKSITSGGPADLSQKLLPGDQIISVNGQTLINIKYDKALSMLQSAPHTVELIVLQSTKRNNVVDSPCDVRKNINSNSPCAINQRSVTQSIPSALDAALTEDELLNEEALKTIYALIKLTKEKVIKRIKEKDSIQSLLPSNLKKCCSENRVYEDYDVGNFSSHESTPEKYNTDKYNTWRGNLTKNRPKRRPLSLSVPVNVNIPNDYLDQQDILRCPSIKSIQSSLNSLDKSEKSVSSKIVALPRNYGLSRRWVGPVRYPVTPCKNINVSSNVNSAMIDDNITRKHFIYGAGDSDDDQIFL